MRTVVFDLFGTLTRWSDTTLPSPAHVIWMKSHVHDRVNLRNLIDTIDGSDGEEIFAKGANIYAYRDIQEYAQYCRDLRIWKAIGDACVEDAEYVFLLCKRLDEIRKLEIYPDVFPLLAKLKKKNVPWIVCSNAAPDVMPKFLDLLTDTDYKPHALLTSSTVGCLKPHPNMYYTLKSYVDSPEKSIFIGDNLINDVLVPRFYGFRSLHIDRHLEISGDFKKDGSYFGIPTFSNMTVLADSIDHYLKG